MSAYRTPEAAPPKPRFVVRYGSPRARAYVAVGLSLVTIGIACLYPALTRGSLLWFLCTPLFLVAIIVGFVALSAAQRGEVELLPEERVLVLVQRRLLSRRLAIPFDDVETVRLSARVAANTDEFGRDHPSADYAINLELRGRTIRLRSSGDVSALKRDHEALVDLLSGHDVLWSVTRSLEKK